MNRPPFHHNAPPGTSELAADMIAAVAPTMRELVFVFIYSRGREGATDCEIQRALGMLVQSETPRRNELVKMGLVVDSLRQRDTRSGRPATVWVASEFAERDDAGAPQ